MFNEISTLLKDFSIMKALVELTQVSKWCFYSSSVIFSEISVLLIVDSRENLANHPCA